MSEEEKKKKDGEGAVSQSVSLSALLASGNAVPHDENAEIAVVGAMLLDSDACSMALAKLNLPGGAFFRPANQLLFNAMAALNPQGAAATDMVVLASYLKKNNQLEKIGGLSYIQAIMDKVPSVGNIEHYIQIVRENAVLRRIISTCHDAMIKCYEAEGNVEELLDMIESQVLEVSQLNQSHDFQQIKPLVADALLYIMSLLRHDRQVMGIPTGYDVLDRAMTGGLKPGMLFILAARPAIGKTALALNMATNIALNAGTKYPVGIFSLEMSSQQLVLRLISSIARVNVNRWAYMDNQSQQEQNDVKHACEMLQNSNIVIDETGGIDILELRSKARRMVEQHGVKVIFIDYLQLISIKSGHNSSRENDVSRISGSLKALAKELSIPIVALAQLSRAAEQGDKPKLSNLRESGAIEQDADVVALLHRDRAEQNTFNEENSNALEAELIIAKNRAGSNTIQNLAFFPQFTRFDPRAKEAAADQLPT